MFKFANNAKSTLAAGFGPSDLAFSVQGGTGALFPAAGNYRVTLVKATGVREIVEVEARATDAFTIMTGSRGLEGTNAETYSSGDVTSGVVVSLNITQGVLERFIQRLASTYQVILDCTGLTADRTIAVPDAAGTMVLHSATQTLSNKTMTGSEFTAPKITKQTLADGASIAWNMASGNLAVVTLGGNRAMANPTNLQDGSAVVIVKQDATGSRTLTWGNAFKWSFGGVPVLSTGANKVDIISFVVENGVLYGVPARDFS